MSMHECAHRRIKSNNNNTRKYRNVVAVHIKQCLPCSSIPLRGKKSRCAAAYWTQSPYCGCILMTFGILQSLFLFFCGAHSQGEWHTSFGASQNVSIRHYIVSGCLICFAWKRFANMAANWRRFRLCSTRIHVNIIWGRNGIFILKSLYARDLKSRSCGPFTRDVNMAVAGASGKIAALLV